MNITLSPFIVVQMMDKELEEIEKQIDRDKPIEVNVIKCKVCGSIIYSRARHDFRTCACGRCFIDGGFDYIRIGGHKENFEQLKIQVNATKRQLYDDWNFGKDKYGFIGKED